MTRFPLSLIALLLLAGGCFWGDEFYQQEREVTSGFELRYDKHFDERSGGPPYVLVGPVPEEKYPHPLDQLAGEKFFGFATDSIGWNAQHLFAGGSDGWIAVDFAADTVHGSLRSVAAIEQARSVGVGIRPVAEVWKTLE